MIDNVPRRNNRKPTCIRKSYKTFKLGESFQQVNLLLILWALGKTLLTLTVPNHNELELKIKQYTIFQAYLSGYF